MKNRGFLFQSPYYRLWSNHFSRRYNTKQKYTNALERFEAFLLNEGFEGELDFDQFHANRDFPGRFQPIRRTVIDQFYQYLIKQDKMTDSLLSATITALKHFFSFLYDMELISTNPMLNVSNPKYERPVKNTALSEEECKWLLKSAINQDPFYRQSFVLIWFMLITGLRVSEVCALQRTHINIQSKIVQVREGQKSTVRPVAISEKLAKELVRYTEHPEYHIKPNGSNDFLFHRNGIPFTRDRVANILKKCSQQAKLSRIVTPHDLRRTTGYLMQVGGASAIEIQRQLGHENLSTTLRYVPPLIDLDKILQEFYPT